MFWSLVASLRQCSITLKVVLLIMALQQTALLWGVRQGDPLSA